jgi:tetratricopeptide (TPR) repeat protein
MGPAAWGILAAGTIAVYIRTFSVPFLFDDRTSIGENLSIRRLWPIWAALKPPISAGIGGRPLLNLSYALNYAFGGTGVFGYHLVNLVVHVLAALTLYGLVRRTLLRPVLAERFGSAATALALAVSAIWAWHPVQTESVTYLSQRAESLMGLFYLLTLYCFVRGACDERGGFGRRGWFSLSVLACLAGVGTKEIIATAPLLVFLYDRTFISGSFSSAWRRHWPVLAALSATWLPLSLLMAGLQHRSVGFGLGVTWWAYGLTECRVILKYICLALWPHPLIFDYGPYAATPLSGLWPYVLVLVSLLAATVVALRRRPSIGFAACWFFLVLAPASSIIPIAGQPMAENRLYLPLAGVVGLVIFAVYGLAGRRALPAFAVVAAALGLASVQRNRAYASELAIWSDTVANNAGNPRAHNYLGNAFSAMPGRINDAVAQYDEALRLEPGYAEAHNNLGAALVTIPGRLEDAIAQYELAVHWNPAYAEAYRNLGNALALMPRHLNDAIARYYEALRLNPDLAGAHSDLGNALARQPGRLNAAIAQFEKACELTEWKNPGYVDSLAVACAEAGDFGEAVKWEKKYLDSGPPKEAAEAARRRLSLFEAGRPYHEGGNPN